MEKKYKLTDETINISGIILYRIEALKDFSDVKKGDKGGFVQSEDNLSQDGDCWIYNNAKAYGKATVFDSAKVFNNAIVYDNAEVYDYAEIYDNARVYNDAIICNHAKVFDYTKIYDNAKIFDNAIIHSNTQVYNNAKIHGNATIHGDTVVRDNANISGNAKIYCYVTICGDAIIENDSDYIIFKNFWSSGRFFVWTRSDNMWSVGCFHGTGKELIEKAYGDNMRSGREYERVVNYVESMLKENWLN